MSRRRANASSNNELREVSRGHITCLISIRREGRTLFEVSLMKKLYGGKKAENESRKKTTSFSSYSIVGMSLRQAQRHETYFPILDNNFLG